MALFVFWVFLSIVVAVLASSKKRSLIGWFFLSLIISPLIALVILLVAGSPSGDLKKCPKCAEEVKAEAQVCRFCGYEFPQPAEPKPSDEEIKKSEVKVELENLRVRFNHLADESYKARTKDERLKIQDERIKIQTKMNQLRGQI